MAQFMHYYSTYSYVLNLRKQSIFYFFHYKAFNGCMPSCFKFLGRTYHCLGSSLHFSRALVLLKRHHKTSRRKTFPKRDLGESFVGYSKVHDKEAFTDNFFHLGCRSRIIDMEGLKSETILRNFLVLSDLLIDKLSLLILILEGPAY